MFSVIIPMAGSGSRCKTSINKALTLIDNKPMFMYSYELFKSYGFEIILVCQDKEVDLVKSYVSSDTIVVVGSDTRGKSVYNGILAASSEYVIIHDAARPLISKNIVDKLLESIKTNEASYVALKVSDTIRDIKNKKTLNRDDLVLAQTPQVIKKDILISAYNKSFNDNIVLTDDIALIEKYSDIIPTVIIGEDTNFKVTTPLDLKYAEFILKVRK